MVQSAILVKNVDKALFENDSAKVEQETRFVRSQMLSKEEIDFHLLMAPAFHDLPTKKSDQLSSLLGAVVKRCMDPKFNDKFKVKKIYTNSNDIRMKYIRGVNSIMSTLLILKIIRYHQFACIELNESIKYVGSWI